MGASSPKDTELAKTKTLQGISEGLTVAEAVKAAGRTETTYERWRKNDPKFAKSVDDLRHAKSMYVKSASRADYVGDFPSFTERYLGSKVFPHQQNIIDVIEGREPSHLHPSMTYQKGLPGYVLVNVPPEHAKSMTVSISYVTYRIAKDPNIRIIIASKTADKAKEFFYGVTQRLTHPRWTDMQLQFAPGGFKDKDSMWQSDKMYLGGALRDSTEKDPTLQALGIGGQIYGARADLIILDDAIVLSNAHEYEKQIRWIQQEVLTRIGPGGKLLILGTRVDAVDLYSEIVDPERYPDGRSPWTLLRMPAVLEFADEPKDWKTLWPQSDVPWSGYDEAKADPNGLYPRWDGPHLHTRRGVLNPKTWAMVYQQQDLPDDGTFHPELVNKSVNGARRVGRMTDAVGHRRGGMDGLYVICSMDPAVGGDAGAITYAVDRETKMRYVLDAECIQNPTPKKLRDLIFAWTDEYGPNEWRIEKNGLNKMLTQDENLRLYLSNRGIPLNEHFTGKDKWDVDFGVASMATLFGYFDTERADNRINRKVEGRQIELPSGSGREGVKLLIQQLITWSPHSKNKQDMVMALWFAEIRARELTRSNRSQQKSFMDNQFLTPDREARRRVIDLNEYFSAKRHAG